MVRLLRVLMVEDSEADAELLLLQLKRGEYEIVWQRVETLAALEHAIVQQSWDLILADYRLPQFTAIAALELLQSCQLDIPFIIVSGSIGEETAVAAMKAGVHDYLMKDNLARLLPAIERELRESQVRSERRQAAALIQYQAFYDELTRLPNRTRFLQLLQAQIEQTATCFTPFAVLYISIDRYQTIKYSLGHALGEQLLMAIAQRLQISLPPASQLARLGTDEFAILWVGSELPPPLPAGFTAEVLQFSRHLQTHLNRPFEIDGFTLCTTGSIGIALSELNYFEAETYLRAADTAKHHAQQRGSGSVVFTQEMQFQAVQRLELEFSLQQAIKHQQLQLHYQPIVELQGGHLVGFEALARWHHPGRGWVPPDTFIAIAEEIGLIGDLGHWVLETAWRQCDLWQRQFTQYESLMVTVNLSVKQLIQPGLVEQIETLCQQFNLDKNQLGLEITESALMENAGTAIALLNQLKTKNIRLAIDDFGTGYSSLSYLTSLPLDTLKIDRTFISTLETDPKNREVVQTMIVLARSLRMNIVAEGIETQSQWDLLRAMGCTCGQGYFFSPPVSPEKMTPILIRGGFRYPRLEHLQTTA